MTQQLKSGEIARFVLPVVAENAFTALVSLVYSAITGALGPGSLAAANTGNQAMNVISALFAMISTGCAILTARLVGRKDSEGASRTAEQTLFITPVLSILLSGLLIVLVPVTMRLLMPGAQGDFLREGTVYFRAVLFSVPALVVTNACAGLLRAAGQSKIVLVSTVLSNGVQLLCIFLFTRVFQMGILGVALAMGACRLVSAAFLVTAVLKNHRGFVVNRRRMLRLDASALTRIFRVGFPASIDALAVQLGYVIINSMLVGMGQLHASVNSVLSSVLLFTGINQGIGSACSTTLVGHLIGFGSVEGARRRLNQILLWCESCSMLLCVPAVLFSGFAAGLFSKDAQVVQMASAFMWIQIPYCFVAVGVNVCEPAVRVGGDVKFAMWNISLCVLLIRIPLTWLFCIRMKLGVHGVYWANITSLASRFLLDYLRIRSSKWGTREL